MWVNLFHLLLLLFLSKNHLIIPLYQHTFTVPKLFMNKFNIIAALLILVGVALFFSLSKDVSTYASFSEATASGNRVKVAGILAKDKEMYYNPQENPNYFSFYLKDQKGEERKVVLLQGKPQDFDRSEQIVVTGEMKDKEFVANEVLLKCPSKYKDEEIYVKKQI